MSKDAELLSVTDVWSNGSSFGCTTEYGELLGFGTLRHGVGTEPNEIEGNVNKDPDGLELEAVNIKFRDTAGKLSIIKRPRHKGPDYP
jgi:hypothetical protein